MAELQVPNVPLPPPLQDPPRSVRTQNQQPPAQPKLHLQGKQVVHLNWSHFKPEFLGKPEEDAEAHILRTSDWMTKHHFLENIKVQRFCLMLVGEARLWYESLTLNQIYKICSDNSIQK